jgi:prolyl oligopeptidase
MKKATVIFFMITSVLMIGKMQGQTPFTPPVTPFNPYVYTWHGVTLTDGYQWLEDKDDEEVAAWTIAQHEATSKYAASNYSTIEGLEEEITKLIDREIRGPIRPVSDRQFFTMRKKGDKQSKLYTILRGREVMIFDPMRLDPEGKASISSVAYTRDGGRAAVLVQFSGREITTAYIIETRKGKEVASPVEGLRGFSWCRDENYAYITVGTQEMLQQQTPLRTYRHRIGDERKNDQFLIAPDDARNYASYWDARYSEVTFISTGDFYATHSLSMIRKGDQEPVELYASRDHRVSPNAIGDRIWIMTNHEAPNFKLMTADLAKPGFAHWKEFYGEKETVLKDYAVAEKTVFILDEKDVMRRLFRYDLKGNLLGEVKLPEFGNISSVTYYRESKLLLVSVSSFFSPGKVYQLDEETLEWSIYYEQPAPIDTRNLDARVVFYPSKDGTRVPMFIIHRKDMQLDGNNPVLLYGYGGFNVGIQVSYVGSMASFINRGGVYAIAGIRGGDEYGEAWHQDGMMHRKQNTFDDFIAAAEYLIEEGYTTRERLAVRGGSNGGLLIGAVITQRPDLFKAAVCQVPLLDMIRYHKFLIARYWIPEYGDAESSPDDFNYILSYSPQHNIRKGINHPTTLVVAGENDTRVDPLHAKKFVGALQNNIGQVSPIMLRMDFDSGHGSGKSTKQLVEDLMFVIQFYMNELGMQ